MSLNLYISNDIEKLVNKLATNIKNNPVDLYQKDVVVIQTEGMSRWLSVKIAEKNKIFSNFDFFSPNNLLFELFKIAGIFNSGLYDTNNLKWIIFNILGSNEFKSKFLSTYLYFENDRIKQLQLATKVADLFDQYIIYRPDYIRLWNENKSPQMNSYLAIHEKWQKWIWLKIKEKIGNNAIDKVQMRDALLEKFKDDIFIKKVKSKFPRISLFGFSLFTLFHIEVFLNALKDIIDVEFYLTNPSPEDYWFKDIKEKTRVKLEKDYENTVKELKLEVGNQLLMNQGRTAKDLYNMLFDIDDIFNVLDNESFVNPPPSDTLLHTIQNDIYYNINNTNRKSIPRELLQDGTIQIVKNYTPVREVETLYNYILKQIEENDYKLKDIIVQTTNIDLYTPIIKAVFDNAEVKIPYTIADRSYKGNDTLIGILKQLLSLQKDEFTSEDILQLLDYDIISSKFNITNTNVIRTLVKNANIRHGISGSKENDTLFVSWKYGLERILLSYAIKSDDLLASPNGDYEVIPLDIVEGDYAQEGLKLKSFVDTLIYFIDLRTRPRKLSEWREYIFDFIDKVLDIGDNTIIDLNYILDKLSFSNEVIGVLDDKLAYDVFFKAFIDSLYSNNRNGRFISGKITFCSMIPMRSIPYKVIAILGLNAKSFPRKQVDTSFDLIKYEYRVGDRNLKETDKYLFFETLLSAKEKLFLSYLGISSKDNSEMPPSLVVDELIEYISVKSEIDVSQTSLIIVHAIDNYNQVYYDKSKSDYYTYLNYGKEKNKQGFQSIEKNNFQPDKFVNIKDLSTFFKNPIKWYFTRILNINYYENSILLPEAEIFELNNLEKHILREELLKNKNLKEYTNILKKKIIKGELPLKNMAKYEVETTIEDMYLVLEYIDLLKSGKQQRAIDFELELDQIIIFGELDNVYEDEIILIDLSTDYFKSLVMLRVYSWICVSAKLPITKFTLLHFNNDKKDMKIKSVNLPDTILANSSLIQLIKIFNKGHKGILPFLPKASYEYLRKARNKTRSYGTPFQIFINILEKKSQYDKYLSEALEQDVFSRFENSEENEIMNIAKLFFNDDI